MRAHGNEGQHAILCCAVVWPLIVEDSPSEARLVLHTLVQVRKGVVGWLATTVTYLESRLMAEERHSSRSQQTRDRAGEL